MKSLILCLLFAFTSTVCAHSFTRSDIAMPAQPFNLEFGDFDADGEKAGLLRR